jgi:enoyl-CoA hydratase
MSYETLLVERQDPVAVVTVNRPDKLNALNTSVRRELTRAFAELGADPAIRALILAGAGEKAFIAGADISEFAGRTPLEQRQVMRTDSVYDAASGCSKPIVAAIHGFCLGGGCELAMACDIRIASEDARLGQPEVNLGIIPGGGGTQRLPRLVGEGYAMKMILTGEFIPAAEALRIGLVDEVVPRERLMARALELAGKIAEKSPVAVRLAREAIKASRRMGLTEGLELEGNLFAVAFSSADKEEGVRAFLDKRKPSFSGH